MTSRDFARWELRTGEFLQQYDPEKEMDRYGMGDLLMPKDLANLGIRRIDIYKDHVTYVWLGGMDHTYLEVFRNPDGSFFFRGQYDSETEKLLHGKDKIPAAME